MEQATPEASGPEKQSMVLGLIAFILSIAGFIMAVAALQTILIGLAVGIAGLIVGIIATTQRKGTGFAVTAIVIGSLSIVAAPVACVGHTADTIEEEIRAPSENGGREYGPGEVATVENHAVTVSNVVYPYTSGNEYEKPNPGNQYVKVTITIKNTSQENINFNPFDYKLEDSRKVQTQQALAGYSSGDHLTSGTLAPGGEVVGSIIFEIPATATPVALLADAGFGDPPVRIRLS